MPVSKNSDQQAVNEPPAIPPAAWWDLQRLAELLAKDAISWPSGLSAQQDEQLLEAVRSRRRSRLVTIISRQIAHDLARDERQEEPNDCREV